MTRTGRVLLLLLAVAELIVTISTGHGSEVTNRTDVAEKSQARLVSYDSYWYNDVNYWWPWFSDLATVIMIKLKIAIGLAAIYAFGDGYYWFKGKGKGKSEEYSSASTLYEQPGGLGFWDKFRWSEPSSFLCGGGWGRRRRRRDASDRRQRFEEDDFVEYLFDSLRPYDEDCRRRVVCEMDFEFRGNPMVHRAVVKYVDRVLGRKDWPKRKEHCKELYGRCRLAKEYGDREKLERRENNEGQSDNFWKERRPR